MFLALYRQRKFDQLKLLAVMLFVVLGGLAVDAPAQQARKFVLDIPSSFSAKSSSSRRFQIGTPMVYDITLNEVPAGLDIDDIRVFVRMRNFRGHLTISVRNPAAVENPFSGSNLGGIRPVTLRRSDAGLVANFEATYSVSDTPDLRRFLRQSVQGTWRLIVFSSRGGRLEEWGVTVGYAGLDASAPLLLRAGRSQELLLRLRGVEAQLESNERLQVNLAYDSAGAGVTFNPPSVIFSGDDMTKMVGLTVASNATSGFLRTESDASNPAGILLVSTKRAVNVIYREFALETLPIEEFSSTREPDIIIPDAGYSGRVTSNIVIPVAGLVYSLEVFVDIEHRNRGDLQVELQAPSGQQLTLEHHARLAGADQRDNLRETYSTRENSASKKFLELSTQGDWKLIVSDNFTHGHAPEYEGRLKQWRLSLQVTALPSSPLRIHAGGETQVLLRLSAIRNPLSVPRLGDDERLQVNLAYDGTGVRAQSGPFSFESGSLSRLITLEADTSAEVGVLSVQPSASLGGRGDTRLVTTPRAVEVFLREFELDIVPISGTESRLKTRVGGEVQVLLRLSGVKTPFGLPRLGKKAGGEQLPVDFVYDPGAGITLSRSRVIFTADKTTELLTLTAETGAVNGFLRAKPVTNLPAGILRVVSTRLEVQVVYPDLTLGFESLAGEVLDSVRALAGGSTEVFLVVHGLSRDESLRVRLQTMGGKVTVDDQIFFTPLVTPVVDEVLTLSSNNRRTSLHIEVPFNAAPFYLGARSLGRKINRGAITGRIFLATTRVNIAPREFRFHITPELLFIKPGSANRAEATLSLEVADGFSGLAADERVYFSVSRQGPLHTVARREVSDRGFFTRRGADSEPVTITVGGLGASSRQGEEISWRIAAAVIRPIPSDTPALCRTRLATNFLGVRRFSCPLVNARFAPAMLRVRISNSARVRIRVLLEGPLR